MFAEWPQSRGWALQRLVVVLTVWECHGEYARYWAINHHSSWNMWFVVRKNMQNCCIVRARMTRSKKCALIKNRLVHSGREAPAGPRRQHLVL